MRQRTRRGVQICFAIGAVVAFACSAPAAANVRPAKVDAYSKYTGVPTAVAAHGVEVQRKGAEADIVGELQKKLGGGFAGVWFDTQASEFVVPLATAGKGQAVSESRKAAAAQELAAASLQGDYHTVAAQFSWSELEAAQDQLGQELRGFFEERIVQTSLDPEANAVVVHVREGAAETKVAAIRSLVRDAGVKVVLRDIGDSAFEIGTTACQETSETFLCSLPMRGGVRIWGGPFTYKGNPGYYQSCSAAFRANGNDGKRYILTAGHCIEDSNGDPIWTWITNDTSSNQSIGTTNQWHWPGKDWAKIDASGTWPETAPWPTQIVAWAGYPVYGADDDFAINGEASSYKQELVCHSGATSGTSCGQVTELNKEVEYIDGEKLNSLTEVQGTELCSKGGDSGGPYFPFATHVGVGILSGGNAICKEYGAVGFYSELKDATAELGVHVAGAGAPEAFTDHNDNVQPYQATLHGRVRPNNLATNYRFEWGKTCYCQHSSEGSAGSGGGTVSVSKTATGLDPNRQYKYRIKATNSGGTAYGSDHGPEHYFTTPPAPPKVKGTGHSNIRVEEEDGKATLHGEVNPGGTDTDWRFEWGKASEGYPNKVPIPDGDAGDGVDYKSVQAGIEGLKGLTEYHYRLRAENSEGTVTSSPAAFETPDWRPGVGELENSGAWQKEETGKIVLSGEVNPKGFATSYHFEWGTQAEYEAEEFNNSSPSVEIGNCICDEEVEQTIEGLKGQTTYHYRLVASNVEGTTNGDEGKSFETPDWRPRVEAVQAGAIGREEATLIAAIAPRGFTTEYRFEWGEDAEYGNSVPGPEGIPPGQPGYEWTDVFHELEGLDLNATYHFRVVAENVEGTRTSPDRTFTTSATGFLAGGYPATITGEDSGEFVLDTNHFGALSCSGAPFQMEVGEESERDTLVTAQIEDPTCTLFGVTDVDVEMNDCKLEFTPGHGEEGSYEGEFAIGPPECGPIVFDASEWSCMITIPAQFGRKASFDNIGEGSTAGVKAQAEASNLRLVEECGPFAIPRLEIDGGIYATWEMDAKNEAGEPLGLSVVELPAPSTEAASDIGYTSATLHGSLITGVESNYYFEYGTTTEYGDLAPLPVEENLAGPGSEPIPLSAAIEGLEAGTEYHYRLVAGTPGELRYGKDMTFATSQAVKTDPASELSAGGATLNGTINPRGQQTEYQFEYGATTEYGSTAPVSPEGIGSGTEDVPVSEAVEGLESGTTYHYRVVAIDEEGTTYGEDRTFTTWGEWSLQSISNPEPPPDDAELDGASCVSASLCVAVGTDHSQGQGVIERWDGSEWEALDYGFHDVTAVDCVSSSECQLLYEAQGSFASYRLNPTSGSLSGLPKPISLPEEASSGKVEDISCTGESACTAVGSYVLEGQTKTLAVRWNGTSWSVQSTPNPESGPAELLGVSCGGASSCLAVGKQGDDPIAARWDGSEWSASELPGPEGMLEGRLAEVSCASESLCMAVGYYRESSGPKMSMAHKWNGSSWSLQSTPNPEGSEDTILRDVSCPTSSSCTAVGSQVTYKLGTWVLTEETLALSWDGSDWAIQPTPNPEGYELPRLIGVSCTAPGACTSVGKASPYWSSGEATVMALSYE